MMQLLGKKIIQRESGSNGNKQVLFHRIDSNKEDQWKAMYHLTCTPNGQIPRCARQSYHQDTWPLNHGISQQRTSPEMKEFCRVCLFHNRRYNSKESSLSCTNNSRAKKHLLFKALVLAGYLIKHLFTKNILQQNSAECQNKAWSQLKKKNNHVPFFPLNQKKVTKAFLHRHHPKHFFRKAKRAWLFPYSGSHVVRLLRVTDKLQQISAWARI